jgi:hypothetical protein
MKTIIMILGALCLIPNVVQAQEESQPKALTLQDVLTEKNIYPEDQLLNGRSFKDTTQLRNALREQGIHTPSTNFHPYRTYCQPQTKISFDAFYNCQFIAMMRERIFNNDLRICDRESIVQYPDNLLKLASARMAKAQYAGLDVGADNIALNLDAPITKGDLKILRRNYYSKCMTEKKWYDPWSWRGGRL